jgi:integrase
MATKRLTEMQAERAKAGPARRALFDGPGGVAGLALRVTPRGVKSWSLMYRVNGKQRRLTLGRHPALSLAEARARARAAIEAAERGVDPGGRRAQRDTVAAVCAQYVDLHCRRNGLRRTADVERMLAGAVLPLWGGRPIQGIAKRDALDLLDGIAGRAPVMANRVQSLIKRVFAWAAERGVLDANPLAGLRPPVKERSRERVLSDDELAAIWRACDPLGWPYGPIVRLLVLTGARRAEVAALGWGELDLDRGVWVKPAARTKSGRAHHLPLPAAAVDLIRGLPVVDDSPFVFPNRTGSGPVAALSAAKAKLDDLSGAATWTIHDLRRTTASGLARLGASDLVVAAVLGHSRSAILGVTSRYDRHGRGDEQRAALERWAGHVERLASGDGAKVIKIA